jgi:hypothetical protein
MRAISVTGDAETGFKGYLECILCQKRLKFELKSGRRKPLLRGRDAGAQHLAGAAAERVAHPGGRGLPSSSTSHLNLSPFCWMRSVVSVACDKINGTQLAINWTQKRLVDHSGSG